MEQQRLIELALESLTKELEAVEIEREKLQGDIAALRKQLKGPSTSRTAKKATRRKRTTAQRRQQSERMKKAWAKRKKKAAAKSAKKATKKTTRKKATKRTRAKTAAIAEKAAE